MTNELPSTQQTDPKEPIPFGMRLKTARETLGLKRKDAADQLRLNEKFIVMMEKDRYPVDLPITFIRGYLRSYGKLLEIPEFEIKKAIEPIKHKQKPVESITLISKPAPVTSGNYIMQILTYLIVLTLFALVGVWWYTHSTVPSSLVTDMRGTTSADMARHTTHTGTIANTTAQRQNKNNVSPPNRGNPPLDLTTPGNNNVATSEKSVPPTTANSTDASLAKTNTMKNNAQPVEKQYDANAGNTETRSVYDAD